MMTCLMDDVMIDRACGLCCDSFFFFLDLILIWLCSDDLWLVWDAALCVFLSWWNVLFLFLLSSPFEQIWHLVPALLTEFLLDDCSSWWLDTSWLLLILLTCECWWYKVMCMWMMFMCDTDFVNHWTSCWMFVNVSLKFCLFWSHWFYDICFLLMNAVMTLCVWLMLLCCVVGYLLWYDHWLTDWLDCDLVMICIFIWKLILFFCWVIFVVCACSVMDDCFVSLVSWLCFCDVCDADVWLTCLCAPLAPLASLFLLMMNDDIWCLMCLLIVYWFHVILLTLILLWWFRLCDVTPFWLIPLIWCSSCCLWLHGWCITILSRNAWPCWWLSLCSLSCETFSSFLLDLLLLWFLYVDDLTVFDCDWLLPTFLLDSLYECLTFIWLHDWLLELLTVIWLFPLVVFAPYLLWFGMNPGPSDCFLPVSLCMLLCPDLTFLTFDFFDCVIDYWCLIAFDLNDGLTLDVVSLFDWMDVNLLSLFWMLCVLWPGDDCFLLILLFLSSWSWLDCLWFLIWLCE